MANLLRALHSPSRRRFVLGCMLVAIGLVAYVGSFDIPFLFDDADSVLNNASLRDGSSFRAFFPPEGGPLGGRPLANLTFAANYRLGGLSPVGYHWVNLAIHLASALIAFAWLSELLAREELPPCISRVALHLAFACAVLWACHPTATYTVSYISQRTEGLMSLCYLTVLFSFWRWRTTLDSRHWSYLAVAVCFAGMACKEGMVTAPLMVWLVDRTFFAKGFVPALKQRPWFYAALACSWVFLAALYLGTRERGIGFGMGVTWSKYLITEGRVILLYLKLIVVPTPLVFDYSYSVYRTDAEDIPFFLATSCLVLCVAVSLWKRPLLGLACAWFFILLAPTSSIVPIASQPMAENRMYLASLGPLVLATVLLYRTTRVLSWPVLATVALVFVQLVVARNCEYGTRVSIWADTASKVPRNPRAFLNLGSALLADGRLNEAEVAFDQALRLSPGWEDALACKGDVARMRGDPVGAEASYRLALAHGLARAEVWRNLGGVLVARKEFDEALKAFTAALAIDPDDALALTGIGDVLLGQGKLQEALPCYERSVALNPDLPVPHNNLGWAYLKAGRNSEALREFAAAVALNPDLPQPQINLATLYARSRDYPNAISHYLQGLRLNPGDVETRLNLGLAYRLSGRLTEAEQCYVEALRRDADNSRARLLLSELNNARSAPAASDAQPTTGAPR